MLQPPARVRRHGHVRVQRQSLPPRAPRLRSVPHRRRRPAPAHAMPRPRTAGHHPLDRRRGVLGQQRHLLGHRIAQERLFLGQPASPSKQPTQKLERAAATLLEAAAEDIEIEDRRALVRGSPGTAVDLARVVQASIPTFARPGVASPDFEASAYHHVPTVTYSSAVHVAQVEVDTGTGAVKLLRYVVAHDCGKVINPIIVEGQVHGGVAQGVGGALFEDMAYDEQGQLLAGSLMDYAIPKADDLPPIETVHLEFPSPRNPLGVKGLGEGGAISPPAAIANAIEDALAPFGVRITETPVTPARIRALLANTRA